MFKLEVEDDIPEVMINWEAFEVLLRNLVLNAIRFTKDFGNIVAFGMGKLGRVSRLASLYCGAAFTYVAADSGQATAPGQFTRSEMEQLLKETGGINE